MARLLSTARVCPISFITRSYMSRGGKATANIQGGAQVSAEVIVRDALVHGDGKAAHLLACGDRLKEPGERPGYLV